jgi:hypothetical protein
MNTITTFTDLVDALQHLTADEIRAKIDELEAQVDGLRRLLCSVGARERAAARRAKLRAEREEAARVRREGVPHV